MSCFTMINLETSKEVNPYNLTKKEKEQAYINNTLFACKCCYPKEKLLYHITETLELHAISHKYVGMHAESCLKNVEYQKKCRKYNPLEKDEKGNLIARVNDNILNRPKRNHIEGGDEHKKCRNGNESEQKMTLSALIKKLNLEISCKQAERYAQRSEDINEKKYQLKVEEDFSKEVFACAKDVRIANRDTRMAGQTLEKDDVAFFYSRVCEIKVVEYDAKEKKVTREDSFVELSSGDLNDLIAVKRENKFISFNLCFANGLHLKITLPALCVALQQYERTYGNKVLNVEEDIIIAAGYQYTIPNKKTSKGKKIGEIDRCTFLLVNNYGIFCESAYEVKCFNIIMDYIMQNQLYNDAKFYKPYNFTKNAYGEANWIEDGVLTIRGCNKVGIVEVFGITDDKDYEEKTKLKMQFAKENEEKFVFLTWKPKQESEDEFKQKMEECIVEIRKSAYKY